MAERGRAAVEPAVPQRRGRFVDVTDETAPASRPRQRVCGRRPRPRRLDRPVRHDRAGQRAAVERRRERFVDDAELDEPSGRRVRVAQRRRRSATSTATAGPTCSSPATPTSTGRSRRRRRGSRTPTSPNPICCSSTTGPSGRRGSFREVAAEVGIEPDGADYGLGSRAQRSRRDGDLDLYVANDTTPNQLYENVAGEAAGFRFVEQGVAAGVGDDGRRDGGRVRRRRRRRTARAGHDEPARGAHVVLRNTSRTGSAFVDALPRCGVPELGVGSTGWGTTLDRRRPRRRPRPVHRPRRDPGARPDRRPGAVAAAREPGDDGVRRRRREVGLDERRPVSAAGWRPPTSTTTATWTSRSGTIGGDLVLLRNSGAGELARGRHDAPSPGTS